MARLPKLSPLIVFELACSTCGLKMEHEVIIGPKGGAQAIRYRCQNADMGCSYQLETNQRISGQQRPIPAEQQ